MLEELKNVKMPEGLNPEVLAHLMQPQNYGKLEDANGIGVALDEKTNEYVIFYLKLDSDKIEDIKFATNGCQDTVVIGSMFSDMIKGEKLLFAQKAIEKIIEKLGRLSAQQEVCAAIVFASYNAALQNFENIQNGADEELHMVKMKESCEVEEKKEDE